MSEKVNLVDLDDVKEVLSGPLSRLHRLQELLKQFENRAYLLKEYWTPAKASRYVEGYWSPKTIRRYVRRGRLPGVVDGHLVMIDREALVEKWRTMQAPETPQDGENHDASHDPTKTNSP